MRLIDFLLPLLSSADPCQTNAGMLNSTSKALRSSAIVNYLSVIHESPSFQKHRSNIPLLVAMSLSDMEPS